MYMICNLSYFAVYEVSFILGLKVCQKIGTSAEMKEVGSKPFTTTYPNCEKYKGNENKLLTCMVKTVPLTFYHPVGTAKMGAADDPTAVVDPELR